MANIFKKNVGGPVPKADAEKWIEKFDKERKKDTTSVFLGKDVFDTIFSDPTVTGISIFFARKMKDGKDFDDVVLVGRREDGTLVWNGGGTSSATATTEGGNGSNTGLTCPPYCS
jgi:hypothetical protein